MLELSLRLELQDYHATLRAPALDWSPCSSVPVIVVMVDGGWWMVVMEMIDIVLNQPAPRTATGKPRGCRGFLPRSRYLGRSPEPRRP